MHVFDIFSYKCPKTGSVDHKSLYLQDTDNKDGEWQRRQKLS